MKKILFAVLGIVIALIIAFVLWAVIPFTVMDEAVLALNSNDEVIVENGKNITFKPTNYEYTKGIIIYPGGKVDSESYSPLAQGLAKKGYLVVLANMPLDLAIFNIDAATSIIEENEEVESWAIAGHSLGGTTAGMYVKDNVDKIDMLVMLGSYVSEDTDLSSTDITVLSLYGTNDYISSSEDIFSAKSNYPSDTIFYAIEGGNHAGFGYYGEQKGDGVATITRDEQNGIVADKIIATFEKDEN